MTATHARFIRVDWTIEKVRDNVPGEWKKPLQKPVKGVGHGGRLVDNSNG